MCANQNCWLLKLLAPEIVLLWDLVKTQSQGMSGSISERPPPPSCCQEVVATTLDSVPMLADPLRPWSWSMRLRDALSVAGTAIAYVMNALCKTFHDESHVLKSAGPFVSTDRNSPFLVMITPIKATFFATLCE